MFTRHSLWPERAGRRRTPPTSFVTASTVGFSLAVAGYFAFTAFRLPSDPASGQQSSAGAEYQQSLNSNAGVGLEPSVNAGPVPPEAAPAMPERATRGMHRANRSARTMLPIIGAQPQFLREETDGSGGGQSESMAALAAAAAPKQEKSEAAQPAATKLSAAEATPIRAAKRPHKTLKRYAKSIKRIDARRTRIARVKLERRRTHVARLYRRDRAVRYVVWQQPVYAYSGWWGW